ncbi:MAG: hypothetical protein FWJ70_06975 [Micromonosporaceae bacterium]
MTFGPHTLAMLRDLAGADHMVTGGGFPRLLGSSNRAVPSLTSSAVPEAEKDRILGGTARSILLNL